MTVHEALDGAKIANPDWRNVRKTLWVDKEHPFKVGKVDESLICNRSPSKVNGRASAFRSSDPYTGLNDCEPLKSSEERFKFKIAVKEDWSPEAIKKKELKQTASVESKGQPRNIEEFEKLNKPTAPRFTIYSKKDAIWSERVHQNNSLRQ